MNNPERQLRLGIKHLTALPRSSIINHSKIYHSFPAHVYGQPNYCNMVIKLSTLLPPRDLLTSCQQIELSCRRYSKNQNAARTLDIDILLYNSLTINQSDFIVPHPKMTIRDFVLLPILEIAPEITLPNKLKVKEFLNKCPKYVFKISK